MDEGDFKDLFPRFPVQKTVKGVQNYVSVYSLDI